MKEADNDDFNNDDQPEDLQAEGSVTDESTPGNGVKVRRRIKVRKRLRIRKKPSIKKKLKKIGEKAFWVIIVAGFITALIVMIVELDIRDEKYKQKKKSGSVKIGY